MLTTLLTTGLRLEPYAMSEAGENLNRSTRSRRLADAIRDVKNAAADRDDVVVELREAAPHAARAAGRRTRAGLRRCAGRHRPVRFHHLVRAAAAPVDRCRQPCLHGARPPHLPFPEGYAASAASCSPKIAAIKPVADQVTRYVAERIVERQRLMDGVAEPAVPACRAMRHGSRAAARSGTRRSAGRPSCRVSGLSPPARWSDWLPRSSCSGTVSPRWISVSSLNSCTARRSAYGWPFRRTSACTGSAVAIASLGNLADGMVGPVRPRRVRRSRPAPGSPEISSRFHCAAGCDPPTAWPAAATPTTGTCRACRRSSAATAHANGHAGPARRRGADRLLEIADAEQPLVLRHGVAHRRMMDHHDAEQARVGPPRRAACRAGATGRRERSRWP